VGKRTSKRLRGVYARYFPGISGVSINFSPDGHGLGGFFMPFLHGVVHGGLYGL